MNYELVLSFYKSFCTKISNLKSFFSEDSTFFFVGDSDKSFIAFGEEDIKNQIEKQFWSLKESNVDKSLIAYNINIEKKTQKFNQKTSYFCDNCFDEVAITVRGTLNAIHSENDISMTKTMGRRFVQTFMIKKNTEYYIQSTVLAFLAPNTDLFKKIERKELLVPLSTVSGDIFDSHHNFRQNTNIATDLDFEKIVQNIDKLIDDNNTSNEDICERQEFNINDLMPISVNELFEENISDKKNEAFNQSIKFEEYFNDIWSQNWIKKSEKVENITEKENNEKQSEGKNQETNDDPNSGISFADVLRDGLQSWQNLKLGDKPQEIRIITNCSKSKFKQNSLKSSIGGKQDYFGQQNITIIGAQNLEEFCDNQIIFVANIPINYPKEVFRNMFDIYGKVLSIKFVERIGVTFAFIYFDSNKSVDEVIKNSTGSNNLSLKGLQLKVDRYKPRIY